MQVLFCVYEYNEHNTQSVMAVSRLTFTFSG